MLPSGRGQQRSLSGEPVQKRPMHLSPLCGALTRKRTRCQSPAMRNGRCRMHGGKSTGPRTPEGKERSRMASCTSYRAGKGGPLPLSYPAAGRQSFPRTSGIALLFCGQAAALRRRGHAVFVEFGRPSRSSCLFESFGRGPLHLRVIANARAAVVTCCLTLSPKHETKTGERR